MQSITGADHTQNADLRIIEAYSGQFMADLGFGVWGDGGRRELHGGAKFIILVN